MYHLVEKHASDQRLLYRIFNNTTGGKCTYKYTRRVDFRLKHFNIIYV